MSDSQQERMHQPNALAANGHVKHRYLDKGIEKDPKMVSCKVFVAFAPFRRLSPDTVSQQRLPLEYMIAIDTRNLE